jgi:GMP synthase (glutamine-hydrolysing)
MIMDVIVIDNGGQWTRLEHKALIGLGINSRIAPNTTDPNDIECDALILSGGRGSVNEGHGLCEEYLELGLPVLGICMGLHIIAKHFGGAVEGGKGEYGRTRVRIVDGDDIFAGLPESFEVWESHSDEVVSMPEGFSLLASSDSCGVQAISSGSTYGVQFHPEVMETQYGKDIIRNFLEASG